MRVNVGFVGSASRKYTYGEGDTVGFGMDYDRNIVFFTKNGECPGMCLPLNFSWEGKLCDLPHSEINQTCYPILGVASTESTFKVNFGEEAFKFNIKSYMNETMMFENDNAASMQGNIVI